MVVRIRLPRPRIAEARKSPACAAAGFSLSDPIPRGTVHGFAPADTGWDTIDVTTPNGMVAPTPRKVVKALQALCQG